jgi:transcriptional regulator with XRE-family HTH domain
MLEKLKVELLRRKISQKELARTLGLSTSHVSRLVRGEARCRARLRRRIAEYLGVPVQKIFMHRRARHRASRAVRENVGK